jgi:phage gp36-like protein
MTRPVALRVKQPAERLLERFEFGQPAGLAIASIVSATVTPAGRVTEVTPLTLPAQSVGLTYALVTLAGGTAGELYALDVLVEYTGGNRFEAEREILVADLSFRVPGQAAPSYLSFEEFVARVGVDEAVRLTDSLGTGTIDAARLDAALIDAQATVDAYLAVRYAVPVALPAPAPIPALTFDLALARLYTHDLPANVAAKRDQALALLADIAAGKAALAGLVEPTGSSPAPVLVETGERLFFRSNMRGY